MTLNRQVGIWGKGKKLKQEERHRKRSRDLYIFFLNWSKSCYRLTGALAVSSSVPGQQPIPNTKAALIQQCPRLLQPGATVLEHFPPRCVPWCFTLLSIKYPTSRRMALLSHGVHTFCHTQTDELTVNAPRKITW